jgi:hypothetical protein
MDWKGEGKREYVQKDNPETEPRPVQRQGACHHRGHGERLILGGVRDRHHPGAKGVL